MKQPDDNPERGSTFRRLLRSPFQTAWRAMRDHGAGSLRSFPELDYFPTNEQARQALRRVRFRILLQRQFYISALAAIVLCLVLTILLRSVLSGFRLPISYLTLKLILVLPVAIPCSLFGVWLMNRHTQRMLRHELLDRGVPICISCGYALIGTTGPNCPECGKPFDERVQQIIDNDPPPDPPPGSPIP